jgi:signal transduction histidine kinase
MVNELDRQATEESVDLFQLASAAVDRAALVYPGSITVQGDPALVVARALDVSRLLSNLVQNACRAAGGDGIVHVIVENDGPWCVLRVADSGPGFTEESGATGIGLGVVAGIVVKLRGQVTLGRGPLGGALVTTLLPRAEPASSADEPGETTREEGES